MSAKLKFANNASGILAGNITNVSTSLSVANPAGALFPALNQGGATGEYFYATLEDTSGNREVIKVNVHSPGSNTMSAIDRGQDGTTAQNFTANITRVEIRVTKAMLETFLQDANDVLAGNLDMGGFTASNGLLKVLDGADAAHPSIWFQNDGNGTGFYRVSSGVIGVTTNGNSRIQFVDSATAPLQVNRSGIGFNQVVDVGVGTFTMLGNLAFTSGGISLATGTTLTTDIGSTTSITGLLNINNGLVGGVLKIDNGGYLQFLNGGINRWQFNAGTHIGTLTLDRMDGAGARIDSPLTINLSGVVDFLNTPTVGGIAMVVSGTQISDWTFNGNVTVSKSKMLSEVPGVQYRPMIWGQFTYNHASPSTTGSYTWTGSSKLAAGDFTYTGSGAYHWTITHHLGTANFLAIVVPASGTGSGLFMSVLTQDNTSFTFNLPSNIQSDFMLFIFPL